MELATGCLMATGEVGPTRAEGLPRTQGRVGRISRLVYIGLIISIYRDKNIKENLKDEKKTVGKKRMILRKERKVNMIKYGKP